MAFAGRFLLVFVAVGAAACGRAPAVAPDSPEGIYARACASCHGETGRGDGPAAAFLYPRPRDFTRNEFKFGGTPDEIAATVRRGVPGTSMPGFGASLTEAEIAAVAAHVRALAGGGAGAALVGPAAAAPAPDAAALRRGRALFAENCAACHGPDGRANVPGAFSMVDAKGIPIRPRDLTAGAMKGGDSPGEIYKRIRNGVPGTPMPGYDFLGETAIWDLVAFVRSLRPASGEAPAAASALAARRVAAVPGDADAPAWTEAKAATIELHPLWARPSWPASVTVRAVHDGKRIAFLLEWPDAAPDRTLGRVEDFVDAAAVMLPERAGPAPSITMGLREIFDLPVRVWHWRAVRDEGSARGPAAAHPGMVRDSSPVEGHPQSAGAPYVGNPLALDRAALEYVAAGVGTLTPVPAGEMRLEARGVWADGRWRVVFVREIGAWPTSVAFAVWDGASGDRNGRKSITGWIPLEVEG